MTDYLKYGFLLFIMVLGCLCASGQVKTIDDYVNAAMANSPSLKETAIKQMQNSIDSSITLADYLPQVSANGIGYYAPIYGQYGYDQTVTNGGEYAALISVSQQISPHKQITLKRNMSADERASLGAQSKVKENDLRRDVTDKYLNVCLLQQQVNFYMQSDSFILQQNKVVKALADKGIYKVSDYYELLVEEKSEHAQIAQLNLDLTQSFAELNATCGITDTTQYKLSIPNLEPHLQKDITQLAEYREFYADSIKLAEQNRLTDADYQPKLSWYADAGILASQPNLIYRSIGNSLGLNLTIPIYDGNKRKLKHQSLQLSEYSRSNYQHFYVANYTCMTQSLAKQIEGSRTLVIQLQQEAQEVDHWIKIDEAEMAVGNIPVTDFLLSMKKNLEVKNDLNRALINQQSLQNEFNYWSH